MNKEKILITALLVMVFAGITIACEPTPPPTPEPTKTVEVPKKENKIVKYHYA